MMTILVSKKASVRQRAPRIKPVQLRKELWKRYGNRCCHVRHRDYRKKHVDIYVLKKSAYGKILKHVLPYDEILDAKDRQTVNVIAAFEGSANFDRYNIPELIEPKEAMMPFNPANYQ